MKAPIKLGLFGAGLVALFFASFAAAGAFVPAGASAAWLEQADGSRMDHGTDSTEDAGSAAPVPGLSVEQDGYQLRELTAPRELGRNGTLSFRLTGPGGGAVTEYDTAHEKDLHLIVVRSDGAQFRHVHPSNDGDGYWSLPWEWDAAGSYRLFADFVPTTLGADITLTSTVSVAGELAPVPTPEDNAVATIGEYLVELNGELRPGAASDLSFTVTRDGAPVTTLEPYLGAFGHLVALREGDLGYLHVHPMGEPGDGKAEPGPEIDFMAEAPTDGKYFLYLDFKVNAEVHTAQFAVTATSQEESEHSDAGNSGH